MKIFIADDHSIVRQGIKRIISDEFTHAEFGEASNGQEALEKIRSGNWDILIMDMSMPVKTGVEVVKLIRAEKINTPVLMVSIHVKEQYAAAAIRAGANAYVDKQNLTDELLSTINKILNKVSA